MDKLNILMFFRYAAFDPRAGGGEVVEWNTMLELVKRGHSIHVAIGKSHPLPEIPNVTFHLIPSYRRRSFIDSVSAILYLIKSINVKNIDIIHGFHPEMVLTNLVHRILKKPIVYEIHFPQLYPYSFEEILNYENRPKALRWGLHMRCDKLSAICSDRIITPSHFMKNSIAHTYNLNDDKICVISNGVNDSIFKEKRKSQQNEKIRILFIGRLVHQKGIDILLRSLKKVIEYKNNIELNIIGEGKKKQEYIDIVDGLKISSFVNFLGFVDENIKIKLLSESTLLVVPSRLESFGISAAEGMAAGLPVIASTAGGLTELIEHDRTGILIPQENIDALTEEIIFLINNPDKRQSIGKAAKKHAENNFTWEKRVDKIEQIYTEIM